MRRMMGGGIVTCSLQGDSPTTLEYQSSCLLAHVVLPASASWADSVAMRIADMRSKLDP